MVAAPWSDATTAQGSRTFCVLDFCRTAAPPMWHRSLVQPPSSLWPVPRSSSTFKCPTPVTYSIARYYLLLYHISTFLYHTRTAKLQFYILRPHSHCHTLTPRSNTSVQSYTPISCSYHAAVPCSITLQSHIPFYTPVPRSNTTLQYPSLRRHAPVMPRSNAPLQCHISIPQAYATPSKGWRHSSCKTSLH